MSQTILILAPRGRDSEIVAQVLGRGGEACVVCPDIGGLRRQLAADTGGVLVTEEALAGEGVDPVLEWIEAQPPWSDIPVIVLATRQAGRRSALAAEVLDRLGNVVILERPVNAETLLSGVKSALRGRRRQYQARAYLAEREEREALLRELNGTLEERVRGRTLELNQARQTLAFALDSAEMASWEIDLHDGQTYRSQRHDRLFGYPELLPTWSQEIFLDHVIEDDRADARAALSKATAEGALDLECRIRRVDGELRWIAAKGRVAYSESGSPERMAGVIMDVSERRFAEEALRQSQKMQAIGQLTGGLAHDFNNLLAGISGSLELVQSRIAQGRTGELDRFITAAQGSAKRAAALTHRLLAFSRRQTLDPKPTNMNRLVAGMEDLVRRTVGPAIRLETACAEGLWSTLCDPNQLENALLNFCINSRDAMPDGGCLTLATANAWIDEAAGHEQEMVAGGYVVLAVSDTGSGMPADVVARAFDPFFTTKPIGTGTGLGLSMAYGFAQQSGGQVRIESEVGQGTTVRLYLPVHDREEASVENGVSLGAVLPAEQGETVLVVDDEATVRMLVVEVLESLGYAALEASDSAAALEMIRSPIRLDLVVSDVGMPGLNGRQLADAARSLRPQLKVLFITGYAENAAVGHDHLEPGMHVLTKPFSLDLLARRIREIITAA